MIINNINMKKCCTCKKEKNLIFFSKNKSSKDGIHPVCKQCRKDYLMSSGRECGVCETAIDRRSIMDRCAKCKNIGRVFSKERNKKVSQAKMGSKNPQWKGDFVGYTSLHEWVRNRLPKPEWCQECKTAPPHDLANISQRYKRELSDWEWLCRKCHMTKDGRLKKLIKRMSLGKAN